ncbi:ATP-binding cassette sub-family A member 3-like [Diaphorina citri]|nr:ATP-binding cassette sub-family A member 3-like [Diaphorina citri]
MFPPSAGEVMVQNYNIFKHMDQFRDSLGLCPQHNLLFPYLSVIQHLIFFGMIKGLTKEESRRSGLDLLTLLNMVEKKNQPVSALSGGMKRKLQLAIALIGSPKVLMLDEPTSGMDPESRREMWDLLLSMRGKWDLDLSYFI